METLPVEPLTPDAFAPFGSVVTTEDAEQRIINEGTTTRFHDLTAVDVSDAGGRACMSLFRATARPRPIAIRMLECHPLGSQTFFPLEPDGWLVVVAQGGETPDLATLRCFRATGTQGVTYAKGAWHHPVLVLKPMQDFFVIDREGPGDNLREVWFDPGAERQISP